MVKWKKKKKRLVAEKCVWHETIFEKNKLDTKSRVFVCVHMQSVAYTDRHTCPEESRRAQTMLIAWSSLRRRHVVGNGLWGKRDFHCFLSSPSVVFELS